MIEEVQLVRLRPDGSRIAVREVAEYLERLRVPANITEGSAFGNDAMIILHFAVEENDYQIVRADDTLTAPLEARDLVRSVLHHFNTIALVDNESMLIDMLGHVHELDEIPEELVPRWKLVPERFGPPVVHVVSSLDPMNHGMTANAARSVVEVVQVDQVSVIRDASGRSDSSVTELTLKSELPAASFSRSGGIQFNGALKVGRKKVTFTAIAGEHSGISVGTENNETLHAFLSLEPQVFCTSRRALPADLEAELNAAVRDPEHMIERVLRALGLPVEAAAWLEPDQAPGDITVVEPQSMMKVMGSTFNDPEFYKDLEDMPFYGRMWTFFRKHPWVGLAFGLFEIIIAVALATIGHDWDINVWIRWIVAILSGSDGIMNGGMAIIRLLHRKRQ